MKEDLKLKDWFDEQGNITKLSSEYFTHGGELGCKMEDLIIENWKQFPPESDIVALHYVGCFSNTTRWEDISVFDER